MKLFIKYIADRIKFVILFFLFFAVFLVTFLLYGLPINAVLYPFSICFLILCVFIVFDFFKKKEKHDNLIQLVNNLENIVEKLPKCESTIDEDYQCIIKELEKHFSELKTIENAKYTDMINYYTVWAHQIKTPIASMELSIQNEDTDFARKLRGELFRIEQYVEMVMAYLRIGSKDTDYLFKKVDIDGILVESIKKFSSEFIKRKIKLEYENIEFSFITDAKWFSFCVEQVLSNALKYTKEGNIKIYLTNKNVLCVEDTGIGIAKEDLPRIFDKGYTGAIGRLDKKASGLGLYLCKNACDKLGIKLYAQSKVDVGTKIYFELPTKNLIIND